METTPVQWLVDQLNITMTYNPIEKDGFSKEQRRLIDQALEMEKEKLESLKDFDTWKEWKNS